MTKTDDTEHKASTESPDGDKDKTNAKNTLYCSFCGKSQHEVRKLIAGPTVFICDECVKLCVDILSEEIKKPRDRTVMSNEAAFLSACLTTIPSGEAAAKAPFSVPMLQYMRLEEGSDIKGSLPCAGQPGQARQRSRRQLRNSWICHSMNWRQ